MDIDRRNGIKRALLGAGVGAVALAGIKNAAAETIVTDEYVSVDGKRFTNAYTAVVGRSGNVDYLCDGVADDVQIQAAIDFVSGLGGGNVLIREGIYNTEANILQNDYVYINGSGHGTIINPASSVTRVFDSSAYSKCSISNMKIECESSNSNAGIYLGTDCVVDDIWFYRPMVGVMLNAPRSSVQNSLFESCINAGVDSPESENVIDNKIRNSKFIRQGFSDAAIRIRGNALSTRGGGNIISDVAIVDKIEGYGIHASYQLALLCTNVIMDRTYKESLYLDDVIISNFSNLVCSVDNSNGIPGAHCIDLNASKYNAFSNLNTVESLGSGIHLSANSDRNSFTNCMIRESGSHGISLASSYYNRFMSCDINNSNGAGIYLLDSSNNQFVDIHAWDDQVPKTQTYALEESGSSDTNILTNGFLNTHLTGYTLLANNDSQVINNAGYNPRGHISSPSIPASGVPYRNVFGYPCMVSVYGGTVTDIAIDAVSTGQTSGVFTVSPGETIALTYSVAPTWRWYGL